MSTKKGESLKKVITGVKDSQLDNQLKQIAVLVKDLRSKERLEIEPIIAYAVWKCISRKTGNGCSWIAIHDVDAVSLFMEESPKYLEVQNLHQDDIVGLSFDDTYNY